MTLGDLTFPSTPPTGPPCTVYPGEITDGGPRCCDLSCVLNPPPPPTLTWEGDDG